MKSKPSTKSTLIYSFCWKSLQFVSKLYFNNHVAVSSMVTSAGAAVPREGWGEQASSGFKFYVLSTLQLPSFSSASLRTVFSLTLVPTNRLSYCQFGSKFLMRWFDTVPRNSSVAVIKPRVECGPVMASTVRDYDVSGLWRRPKQRRTQSIACSKIQIYYLVTCL